jgi:glutaredoxin-like protein
MTEARIIVYSTDWCPDCRRARKFLNDHQIPFEEIDIKQNPEHADFVKKANGGKRVVPTIIFLDGTILSEPSNAQLAAKLGVLPQGN